MKNTKMLALCLLAAVAAAACQSMPDAPKTNRTVVAPRGSEESVKPWSNPTKQEGDAAMGPLSGLSELR